LQETVALLYDAELQLHSLTVRQFQFLMRFAHLSFFFRVYALQSRRVWRSFLITPDGHNQLYYHIRCNPQSSNKKLLTAQPHTANTFASYETDTN